MGSSKGKSITILIQLSAERFLHKSTLNLGKFEAVEEVSAYSWVFFIQKIYLANENSNKWTCIHLQAELNREASNTAIVLFVFFTKFTQSNSMSNRSYSSTELSKERLFVVEILQPAFQGLALSRFSCSTKQYTECLSVSGAWWQSLQTFLQRRTKPHNRVACLFLIFCIHFIALSIILQSLSLCIFTKISWLTINFKTENGFWLRIEYYAFAFRVDQVNFFAWEVWGLGL